MNKPLAYSMAAAALAAATVFAVNMLKKKRAIEIIALVNSSAMLINKMPITGRAVIAWRVLCGKLPKINAEEFLEKRGDDNGSKG